jgi:hypothetical protein
MTAVLGQVSLFLVAAGIVVAGLVLLTSRSVAVALPIMLDILLAAGLLRLSATATWTAIMSASAIVIIRKLAVAGISKGYSARRRSAPDGRR